MSFTVENKDETTRFFLIIQTKANILTADQKQKQKAAMCRFEQIFIDS